MERRGEREQEINGAGKIIWKGAANSGKCRLHGDVYEHHYQLPPLKIEERKPSKMNWE